ncbi:penicillin-binding protein 1B [Bathymodiolus japonicus methanotrophic gill symbiont]|uniref:penicillin-binding protein 1B n=1 Tax=Bathymodiolus japonicus methanotrophic gill symbiont TaxID=113269 RepID=UPI001B61A7B4|nr:penicillin-binding protein 1B [Bathymodiolus japonicus methanotrophic gill symbiont]GFO71034.1 penicillin-binding protein 1B [Bathymodiolus japonicus methanotrophic gill symbiont]
MAESRKPVKPRKTRKPRQAGKTAKRKSRAKQKPSALKRSWLAIKIPLLKFCALLFFVFICYLGYLDYTVSKQFEGKRWAIPAHVYASPVEVYAGSKLNAKQLIALLKKLHYRADSRLSSQATYKKSGHIVSLKTRQFVFPDTTQQVQHIRIAFSSTEVRAIRDIDSGRELAIVRLDPVQIGSFYPAHKEDRVLVKLDEVPKTLIQGLLATEDRDFYQHMGISLKGIARAMWINLRAGKMVQGGSTITQQLVKNFYLTPERSLIRKINEALMALILEFRFSKDEILEAYLNEVYLGQDGAHAIHGFGLASEFYFSRPLSKLPLDQVTALIALVRGPSYYDLRKQPKRALKRRNLVLDEMLAHGDISEKQAQHAKHEPIKVVAYAHRPANRYPAFIDLVKRQLTQEYNDQDLTSEGLSIFTTLDTQVQDALDASIKRKLAEIEKRKRSKKLETAAIVTRRDSGEIVALAGGRDSQGVGFNRALNAVRPIGSLIKPLVYLTALEYPEKYTLITAVSDTKIKVKAEKGKFWEPKNYGRKEHGNVALHTALAHSYNLATVHIGMDIGLGRIAKTLRETGVKRPINLFPSMLLGALTLTPFEVTQMYQTLAGDGFAMPLRSISAVLSHDGAVLQRYPYALRQELDPAATYLTNTILQEVMREGTGKSAYKVLPKSLALAGKTGTTNDLKDSWFAGYSGDYLAVFWVGRDDNKSTGVTGASGALKLWTELMRQVAKQPVILSMPDSVISVWIDRASGLKVNELCPDIIAYPFVRGSEPSANAECVETTLNKVKTWFNDFKEENF